eukprot:TRINITY_DN9077_c0_g1_i6.p1 TRINITY_DN9077_c0_g1~~TRINITY_DN9077_c0_g1_i6.p1  ORF type:complete len:510 (+),score=100.19 TRINITY_DN9077_c0_g1_i6:69-1598(+)
MKLGEASVNIMSGVSRYQGVDKEGAGYKLLTALGWKEGDGLGANKQGMKSHIKIKQKLDTEGVGAKEALLKNDWSLSMMNYDHVLKALSEITSQYQGTDLTQESDDEDEDDDMLQSDASNGKKVNQEKIKREKGKKSKQEYQQSETNLNDCQIDQNSSKSKKSKKRDKYLKSNKTVDALSTIQEANGVKKRKKKSAKSLNFDIEENEAKLNSKQQVALNNQSESDSDTVVTTSNNARNAGHSQMYQKRRKGKIVENYSSTDLAAIFGHSTTQKVHNKREKQTHSSKILSVKDSNINQIQEKSQVSQDDSQKWWQGYFVRSSERLGACQNQQLKQKQQQQIQINGFREEDQEALYNKSKELQVQGRVGLGKKSHLNFGESTWQGSKKMISDSDEEDDDDQINVDQQVVEELRSKEIIQLQELITKPQQKPAKKIKWKRIIKKAIKNLRKLNKVKKGSFEVQIDDLVAGVGIILNKESEAVENLKDIILLQIKKIDVLSFKNGVVFVTSDV